MIHGIAALRVNAIIPDCSHNDNRKHRIQNGKQQSKIFSKLFHMKIVLSEKLSYLKISPT